MPRPLKQSFRCQPLEDLTRQLLFAPPVKRAEQVRRTERLHDEIEPDATYPLDYLVYRITGYRRDAGGDLLLVGEAVQPDLRLIIDRLSRSVNLARDADEPAETAAELAARLGVSTKTVHRWRDAGLRWRWEVPADGGRRQVVYLRSAVERFVARHRDRVQRASQFSQIDPDTRQRLIERARRLAEARDVSLNQVATFLARKTGRAVETIRLLLERHDREHPESAIFIDHRGPLSPKQKRVIERAYRRGVSVSKLARRFERTRPTIYRAIHKCRAAAAAAIDLTCVPSPTFDRDDADEVILRPDGEAWPTSPPAKPTVPLASLPEALRPLYHQPAIPAKRQRSLFIRYNYLKHKAARIREGWSKRDPRAADLDRFDECVRQAWALRSLLVRANLPVVLSVARRHHISDSSDRSVHLFDLLEQGQAVLLEAVDSYNYTRSGTFESYLTNKLLQRFASDEPAEPGKARRRVRPEQARDRLVAALRAAGVGLDDVPSKPV